jgi:hypothetical protein
MQRGNWRDLQALAAVARERSGHASVSLAEASKGCASWEAPLRSQVPACALRAAPLNRAAMSIGNTVHKPRQRHVAYLGSVRFDRDSLFA